MADTLSVIPWWALGVFFGVAFAYASVGLGGGSSYTALMALFGLAHTVIPTLSLTLNLLVTSVSSFNYLRAGHLRVGLLLPFLVTSIPCAYLGGTLDVSENLFLWLLLAALVFVALRIYFWDSPALRLKLSPGGNLLLSLGLGCVLGLVAGIVGIGGGVFLVPLILVFGLGTVKEAAASGALFVWLNSAAGLAARIQHQPVPVVEILPLAAAVLAGGILGSYLGARRWSPRQLEKVLGVIIIIAIAALGRRIMALA
ncbi:MAG: sulfite exporter TauE/SafE family protein [Pseudomonadota bacterium]